MMFASAGATVPAEAISTSSMDLISRHGKSPLYIHCKDALDFFEAIKGFGRRGWIFRGHSVSNSEPGDRWSKSEWRLESSLWRHLTKHQVKIIPTSWYARERDSLRRFKQAAHNYINHLPADENELSWLALMQHFGSPTRLLDFTFNPAIAAFFAIREANPATQPWCVHALHVETVRGRSFLIRQNKEKSRTVSRWPRISDYNVGKNPRPEDFVGIIDGSTMNVRQAAQEGLFLVPSKVDLDLEGWLSTIPASPKIKPYGTHWIKFTFAQSSYYETLKQLLQFGMSPVRLFPGLEGLAESMRFNSFDPVKDFDPGDETEEIYTATPP